MFVLFTFGGAVLFVTFTTGLQQTVPLAHVPLADCHSLGQVFPANMFVVLTYHANHIYIFILSHLFSKDINNHCIFLFIKMSRDIFLKAYANLPEPERYHVIAIVDNKTYSWNTAYIEISNNTELGKKILKKIEVLEIL